MSTWERRTEEPQKPEHSGEEVRANYQNPDNAFHRKYKFEALDKPELLDEYLEKK